MQRLQIDVGEFRQIKKVTEENWSTPKIRDEIVFNYTQDRKDVTGKKKSADT